MNSIRFSFAFLLILFLVACQPQSGETPESQSSAPKDTSVVDSSDTSDQVAKDTDSAQETAIQAGEDYHSYANSDQVVLNHIALDWTIDFDKKVIDGSAELSFEKLDAAATKLIVDTRDLTIHRVESNGEAVSFKLGNADPHLGAPLSIDIPESIDSVTVFYTTSPSASGLQWLTPEQTSNGKHPFLFSQAQAIHARSFIPLQDSPKVRVTYEAVVRTPAELLAVMSASNEPNAERDGEYQFSMPQPIPSYLIAIAVGDLYFQSMGERTGVYAESEVLAAAAAEFEDTESMLIETEKLYGPYAWDRYDLLILPPSFPFGGMENPRLSFITPTVIAGDKSLVALIAHELAHSWSGNSVTNATWRDLWLNEGFTTYLTYRIMELIFGEDRYRMEAVLGFEDLQNDIQSLESNDQIMAIDLRGRDPDDVFSNIPYEKGALFLRELERKVGRENFDAFLLEYFKEFEFKSITTDEFVAYLNRTLIAKYPEQLNAQRINAWIFEGGLPESLPLEESAAFSTVDQARTAWLDGSLTASKIDTSGWVVHQWLYFLNNMPDQLTSEQLSDLDAAFNLTASKNNEIAHSWLLISVKNWYEPALPRLREYLVTIGRNKLVKPLYRELSKTERGLELARKAFEKAKPGYHPLTVKANEGFLKGE